MPRPRKGPHRYRRPGRPGWWAYLDRDHKHIPLADGSEDERAVDAAFAALLERYAVRRESEAAQAGGGPRLSVAFDTCHERALAAHTPKTAYELELNLRRVLVWLEERGVTTADQITKATVEDYKTARRLAARQRKNAKGEREKVSAARVNRELDSWLKAMRVAVEEGADPAVLGYFTKLREPRPAPHQRRLNKGELTRFLRSVDGRYRTMLRLVLGSGIRDEELRHLQPGWLRLRGKERWLEVSPGKAGDCECCPSGWTTKGYRYRRIPLSASTVRAVRAYLKAPPPSMGKKQVWTVIQEGRVAAKVKLHFSLHDLRRAWATALLDAGNTLQNVSHWLGHRDVITTMRYLGIADESMPEPEKLPW